MKVGVAKETVSGERRVALVPEAVQKLRAADISVLVERGVTFTTKEQAQRLGNAVADMVNAAGGIDSLAGPAEGAEGSTGSYSGASTRR